MGKAKAPAAPAAPDPVATANAQTGSNIDTAVANTWLNNPTVNSVYGTTASTRTGSQWVNGIEIPTFTQTTTLSPDEQKLFDQQNQLGQQTNDLALGQVGRIGTILNTDAPKFTDYLGDPTTQRDRVEAALMARLNPSLQNQSDALENKLVNQGLQRGTAAFNTADDANNRAANDARLGVISQAGQEEDRAYAEAQQRYTNDLTARDAPINELSALAGFGQVQNPQVAGFQGGSVATTPVANIIEQNYQDRLGVWKQQAATAQANNAATMGGLFGLGGAALGGLARSDRRLKRDIASLGIRLRNGLPLYSYRMIDDGSLQIGVMADEVDHVMPQAVLTMPDGFKAVDYGMIF